MSDVKGSWVFAIDEKSLENSSLKLANIGETPILIVKKDGKLYALDNRCSHIACPLSSGKLEGFMVKCPCHDWRFDIRTGEFIDAPEVKLPVFQVKVTKGKIYVKI